MDRYEVFEPIGEGSTSIVYAARDMQLGQDIAIKQLRPESKPPVREEFLRQGGFLRGLSGENVVRVFDVDGIHNRIIMERLSHSLDKTMALGPMPAEQVESILAQILMGLKCIHATGRIHGAIHPSSVLVAENGEIKLSDTGGMSLQEEFRRPDSGSKYIAPEILDPTEFGVPSEAVDLYGAGMLAIEMLTGKKFVSLFKGIKRHGAENTHAWARWHASPNEVLEYEKILPSNTPAALRRVIGVLTRKYVSDRYSSAREALQQLQPKGTLTQVDVQEADATESEFPAEPSVGRKITAAPSMRRRAINPIPKTDTKTKNRFSLSQLNTDRIVEHILRSKQAYIAASLLLLVGLLLVSGPKEQRILNITFVVENDQGERIEANIDMDDGVLTQSDQVVRLRPGRKSVKVIPIDDAYKMFEEVVDLDEDQTVRLQVPSIAKQTPKITKHPAPKETIIAVNPLPAMPALDSDWIDPEPILHSLVLQVEPADAKITINGQQITGASPYLIRKPQGVYTLFASHVDFQTATRTIRLPAMESDSIVLASKKTYPVQFSTSVAGTTVEIDGNRVGNAPLSLSLSAGNHRIRLSKPGYRSIRWNLKVDGPLFPFWYMDRATNERQTHNDSAVNDERPPIVEEVGSSASSVG